MTSSFRYESMLTRLTATLRTPAARDGAVVMFGQGFSALISLALSSFLFHRLSKADQGALTAGTTLTATLLQASDFGLALITIRLGAKYLADGQQGKALALFRVTLLLRLALALMAIAAALLFADRIASDLLAMPGGRTLIWGAALGVLGAAVVWWGVDVAQARRQFGAYAVQQVFHASIKVLAVALIFVTGFAALEVATPEKILFALCAANLIAGAASVIIMRGALLSPRSGAAVQHDSARLLQFGVYACAASILTALSANSDVLLVQHFLREEDTAVFGCARQLTFALTLLATATFTVLLPRASALNSRASCAEYVRKALGVGVPLALVTAGGLALAAGIFVPLFAGPNYVAAIPILRWLCIAHGIGIALLPLTLVFFPLRREGMLVSLTALQLAVQIGVSIWLIPTLQLQGAAWALVASKAAGAFAFFFMLVWAFRRADAVSNSETFD